MDNIRPRSSNALIDTCVIYAKHQPDEFIQMYTMIANIFEYIPVLCQYDGKATKHFPYASYEKFKDHLKTTGVFTDGYPAAKYNEILEKENFIKEDFGLHLTAFMGLSNIYMPVMIFKERERMRRVIDKSILQYYMSIDYGNKDIYLVLQTPFMDNDLINLNNYSSIRCSVESCKPYMVAISLTKQPALFLDLFVEFSSIPKSFIPVYLENDKINKESDN